MPLALSRQVSVESTDCLICKLANERDGHCRLVERPVLGHGRS